MPDFSFLNLQIALLPPLVSYLGRVVWSRSYLPDELTAWDDLDRLSIRWRHLFWLLIHSALRPQR